MCTLFSVGGRWRAIFDSRIKVKVTYPGLQPGMVNTPPFFTFFLPSRGREMRPRGRNLDVKCDKEEAVMLTTLRDPPAATAA